MIDLGDKAHLEFFPVDGAGNPVDVTASIVLVRPDLSTVTPAPTINHDGTGQYSVDWLTDMSGIFHVYWTGANPDVKHSDTFHVEPAADIAIVSMSNLKRQLKIKTNADDDDLRGFILSASENIEAYVGVCSPRVFTDDLVTNYGASLFLPHRPVISLASVTPLFSWQTTFVAATDLVLTKRTGEIRRVDGGLFRGDYGAVSTAGRQTIPHSIRTAAEIIVSHLWGSRRGTAVVPSATGSGLDLVQLPGWSYAIPARAAELLRPFRIDRTVMA